MKGFPAEGARSLAPYPGRGKQCRWTWRYDGGMRIATWNINGLRARLDLLLLWLRDRKPDVVGLQELKLEDRAFPRAELEAAGYHALVHGQKSWNGVAILSRQPAVATQIGLPGQEAAGARLLSARVGDLSFTTVYCPNGKHTGHDDFAAKLAWFEALAAHLATVAAAEPAAVVGGDFNIVPAAIDSFDEGLLHGTIFHTDAERARFAGVVEAGFVDVFRAVHPDTQAFSWWDYRGGAFHRKQGLRIDLLLATPAVVARVQHVEIDREFRKKQNDFTPSDHAPVIADLG
jgi:exodeoxyribonuclease-3